MGGSRMYARSCRLGDGMFKPRVGQEKLKELGTPLGVDMVCLVIPTTPTTWTPCLVAGRTRRLARSLINKSRSEPSQWDSDPDLI